MFFKGEMVWKNQCGRIKIYDRHTKRSDLHSQESALTSAPQYIVAFFDDGVDESYVQILYKSLKNQRVKVSKLQLGKK